MKLRSHVELMAELSPMCSIMVARAIGMMVMMAVSAIPELKPGPNRENTVFSHSTGRPIHAALSTPEKSTTPIKPAIT